MVFETSKDVLNWYEKQPRVLTPEFINSIPWHAVREHTLPDRLVPVLLYMRDVENLTDVYHREMLRTPTGRDPDIGKFMERWGVEESTHGELLDRFLNEAGFSTPSDWRQNTHGSLTLRYRSTALVLSFLTNFLGRRFVGTHMAFGAIHEMETAQGYRTLIEMADHPVLTHILEAIIREESAHKHFYWCIARLELSRSESARKLARYAVERFWAPVGEGATSMERSNYVVRTLFSDGKSRSAFHRMDRASELAARILGFYKDK
jgi:hypothetical protein